MQSEEGQSKREIPIRARCPVYERGQRQDSGVGMTVQTGKSRTDRRGIPILPIEYRIFRKKRNQEKIRENLVKTGTKTVEGFSRPNSRISYFIR